MMHYCTHRPSSGVSASSSNSSTVIDLASQTALSPAGDSAMAAAAAAAAARATTSAPEPTGLAKATVAGADSERADAVRAAGRVAAAVRPRARKIDAIYESVAAWARKMR